MEWFFLAQGDLRAESLWVVLMNHYVVKALAALFSCALASAVSAADPAGARKLYRYTNENGGVVLDFQIPPDQIYRGYTVLSPGGTVLEVVPPSMTPQEREELKRKEPERLKVLDAQKKREEDDRKLLAVFTAPSDAERARDRKLEALDLQISVDKGNVARLQADLDATQMQAANKERSGQEVPDFVVEKIDSLTRQIAKLGEGVKVREKEKQIIREAYALDIERLKYLLAHPDKVRTLQSQLPKASDR